MQSFCKKSDYCEQLQHRNINSRFFYKQIFVFHFLPSSTKYKTERNIRLSEVHSFSFLFISPESTVMKVGPPMGQLLFSLSSFWPVRMRSCVVIKIPTRTSFWQSKDGHMGMSHFNYGEHWNSICFRSTIQAWEKFGRNMNQGRKQTFSLKADIGPAPPLGEDTTGHAATYNETSGSLGQALHCTNPATICPSRKSTSPHQNANIGNILQGKKDVKSVLLRMDMRSVHWQAHEQHFEFVSLHSYKAHNVAIHAAVWSHAHWGRSWWNGQTFQNEEGEPKVRHPRKAREGSQGSMWIRPNSPTSEICKHLKIPGPTTSGDARHFWSLLRCTVQLALGTCLFIWKHVALK